jgi:hypothetical protein
MRIITGKQLSRRTVLRGLGAAIALPVLDAMTPALAAPVLKKAPLRLSFVYVPNGIVMKDWTPAAAGQAFQFPRILQPLEPFRQELLVLSGLDAQNGNALGDGPGDHARAGASFLTGVHCRKTMGADIRNGVSADQIAAQALGERTRFASIELGCEDSRTVGDCDSGYSCAYTNSISWRGPSTPMPPEVNPRLVFERLFGADAGLDPQTRARRALDRKSILDLVREDTARLVGTLGRADRRKIDEYLTGVRDIEKRIQSSAKESRHLTPPVEPPSGIPADFAEYVKLMYDLQVAAFQTDLTRVASLMVGREGSLRVYPEIGVPDSHHPLTHHRGNPEWIEKVVKINHFHVEMLAYFLGKLKATPDGDGTLLDHAMIVYGSGLSDGNRHTHEDLPILLAGGGGGTLQPGRHLTYPPGTCVTNLYMALLDRMGVHPKSIGDSTGEVTHLSDL